jgi:hypothetical protein
MYSLYSILRSVFAAVPTSHSRFNEWIKSGHPATALRVQSGASGHPWLVSGNVVNQEFPYFVRINTPSIVIYFYLSIAYIKNDPITAFRKSE